MLNAASLFSAALGETLDHNYTELFGTREPDYGPLVRMMAGTVMERIANSDALYHDAGHTMLVTLVGQSILKGKMLVENVTPEDWLHFTIALLCHDIGYLRGICPGDRQGAYIVDADGRTESPPRGASDAWLTPFHIERGKIFVRHRCKNVRFIDAERIARGIELTRFPFPNDADHQETDTEAGLVRAADLIGQLGDPYYPRKLNALFYEFVETGTAERLGYTSPADLAEHYPRFFWATVEPYIEDALAHLDRTQEGKGWIAQLYAHVFVEEHLRNRAGPERERPPRPVVTIRHDPEHATHSISAHEKGS